MSRLYHNPRCSKSRAALEYLKSKNIDFSIIEYLKTSLSLTELKGLCVKLNISPKELIRTNDQYFKDLSINNFDLQSEQFYYELLVDHPKLLERPIYETENTAAIGRPLENIIHIL